ncbi:glycosyltransferase [Fulvivirga sp.]|uniref:glycosyltransferase n=1 Tax=Fulvivirga sp. TaxID=1931237 RepID=UPI0032ED0189
MKAIFVYDHNYLKSDEGIIYSSGAFNSSSWERYLEHFDQLTVIGHNVDFDQDLRRYNVVSHPKVSFRFFKPIKSLKSFVINLFKNDKSLKELVKSHDALIVRIYSEYAFQAIRIAKMLDKPYAVELVGCPWDAYRAHQSFKAKLIAPYSYFRLRRAIWKCKFVLYVTDQFLQSRYPTKGRHIGASNVMLTEPSSDILTKRLDNIKKLELSNEPLNIGVIGKVDVKAKGIGILIKALGQLNISFKLHIVGPGNQDFLKPIIKKYELEDSILFHGKLMAGEQINVFLDSIDLYVHPSMQEGLPRSVIEAMARACPVLASSIAGTPELLHQTYLHQPGNHNQLSEKINYIYRNLGNLSAMALENFEKAKNYYPEKLNDKRKSFWGEFYEFSKAVSKNV